MRKSLAVLASVLAAVISTRTITFAQPSSRLLVLNKEDATLAIVDPVAGSILGRVPVGQGPHELVVSTDGRLAFASNYGTGAAPGQTISMVDIAAQKELRRIDVSPLRRPHGLAFANGKLYFTAEANRKIARYDPATDKIDWEFETGQNGTHMVLPTADAKILFTSNIASNSVSAIQQAEDGSWTQAVIPVGKGPEGIDLSRQDRLERALAGWRGLADRRCHTQGPADDRSRYQAVQSDPPDARRQARAHHGHRHRRAGRHRHGRAQGGQAYVARPLARRCSDTSRSAGDDGLCRG